MLTCLAMMENNLIDFLQARSLNNKRFLRPNNSAAAALQLAAPVLQQRTVSLQSHTKNETGNRKTLKDIQQLDKSSPRT